MASQKLLTKSSPYISAVSQVTALTTGCVGFPRRSTFTTQHTSHPLRDTPFRVVYGHEPPSIRSYELGDFRVVAVDCAMADREAVLADVKYLLEQAQTVAKCAYDCHHRTVSFKVGDWVWFRVRSTCCPRCVPWRVASSVHISICAIRSSRRSTRWPSVCACRPVLASMMFSTWPVQAICGYSTISTTEPVPHLQRCTDTD